MPSESPNSRLSAAAERAPPTIPERLRALESTVERVQAKLEGLAAVGDLLGARAHALARRNAPTGADPCQVAARGPDGGCDVLRERDVILKRALPMECELCALEEAVARWLERLENDLRRLGGIGRDAADAAPSVRPCEGASLDPRR